MACCLALLRVIGVTKTWIFWILESVFLLEGCTP